VLSPLGIKSTQFVLLRFLAQRGPTPQWKISEENAVAVETLSRRLAGLRSKGFIAVEIAGAHGEHICRLTPSGQQAYENAKPYWQRADARLQQVLGDGKLQEFVACLNQLAAAALEATMLRTKNCSLPEK
jgi:DNA-binding MarR family transcriptional regulator